MGVSNVDGRAFISKWPSKAHAAAFCRHEMLVVLRGSMSAAERAGVLCGRAMPSAYIAIFPFRACMSRQNRLIESSPAPAARPSWRVARLALCISKWAKPSRRRLARNIKRNRESLRAWRLRGQPLLVLAACAWREQGGGENRHIGPVTRRHGVSATFEMLARGAPAPMR